MSTILVLLIAVIIFIYTLYYVIIGVENEDFEEFPLKYKDLNITEHPIEKFSTYYYVGKNYFSTTKFPLTKIYFYKNFLVAKYRGHAQVFEYNKNTMLIKKDIRGNRVSILTDLGEAYFFVNKKQMVIFNFLLEETSKQKH